MMQANINTPEYWNAVYREECGTGRLSWEDYHRNYGPIHDAIIRLVPDGSRVLDIACGAGLLCRKIKQALPSTRVMGVDFSQYMISENEVRDRSLEIEYRCLDIRTALGAIDRQFDVVTMCEILEHLEQPEALVAAAMTLLRSGGRFILSCPHDDSIPDPEHVRIWGHDDLFHLLAQYSDTVSFMHFPPPYFHVWMLAYLTKAASGEGGPA
ncbi:MAG: class I SAM-dependent methyltransferase [Verrucomicrobiota bacterium]|jgi:2-polyprenyl-3-methyl-5-hydroxy-6-metoxy-1,4-benzoquinol methylase